MSLKDAVRRVVTSDAVYPLLRRRAQVVPSSYILTYHTLGPDEEHFDAWTVTRVSDFLRHIAFVRLHHDIVSLDDALREAALPSVRGSRPKVVLTFDDGHSGWHDHLLPVVERERLPVTLYTATSHVATSTPYWFDRVMNAVQVSRPTAINLRPQGLKAWTVGASQGFSNWIVISEVLEALKASTVSTRDTCVLAIEQQCKPFLRSDFEPLRPLTVAQLQAVSQSPFVTVAAHSEGHELLDTVPPELAMQSMRASRMQLQEWTGQAVNHFAFPNGNFSPSLTAAARQIGFATAATTVQRAFRSNADRYQLPRISVGRFDTMDQFRLKFLRT